MVCENLKIARANVQYDAAIKSLPSQQNAIV